MSWDSGQGGMSRDSGRVCEREREGYSPDSGWEGGLLSRLGLGSRERAGRTHSFPSTHTSGQLLLRRPVYEREKDGSSS